MSTQSISYETTLLYAEGLELYDSGDNQGALNKFKECLLLAPTFQKAKNMIDKLS